MADVDSASSFTAPKAGPSSTKLTPDSRSEQPADCRLLQLPNEVLHRILVELAYDAVEFLGSVAQTCRSLRETIYGSQALWRDVFVLHWDDPRRAAALPKPRSEIDWKQELQDRTYVSNVILGSDMAGKEIPIKDVDLVCQTLLKIVLDVPEADPHDLYEAGGKLNVSMLSTLFQTDPFHALCAEHLKAPPQEFSQTLRSGRTLGSVTSANNPVLSRLHATANTVLEDERPADVALRGLSRSLVYSAKHYHEGTDYGPFHIDGTVNWVLLDAISTVMTCNAMCLMAIDEPSWRPAGLLLYDNLPLQALIGFGFNNLSRPARLGPGEVWDWADVRGTWCGSYAFLDYADWIELNEPNMVFLNRRARRQLDLEDYDEAVGDLMRLELEIDGDEELEAPTTAASGRTARATRRLNADLPKVNTSLPTSDLLPPIHFHGASRWTSSSIPSPTHPNTFVRGVVQLTADDPPQIRWTIIIHYGGEDRWRLECVQIGLRGSKRGLYGIWTAANPEDHSPNGPVWYFKDPVPESAGASPMGSDFDV